MNQTAESGIPYVSEKSLQDWTVLLGLMAPQRQMAFWEQMVLWATTVSVGQTVRVGWQVGWQERPPQQELPRWLQAQ